MVRHHAVGKKVNVIECLLGYSSAISYHANSTSVLSRALSSNRWNRKVNFTRHTNVTAGSLEGLGDTILLSTKALCVKWRRLNLYHPQAFPVNSIVYKPCLTKFNCTNHRKPKREETHQFIRKSSLKKNNIFTFSIFNSIIVLIRKECYL